MTQMAYRRGWRLDESAAAEEVGKPASDAAHSGSSLHLAAHRINAFDAQMTDMRSATRAGFLTRSLFAFLNETPHSAAPGIDQFSKQDFGTVGGGDEESDNLTPPVGEGVGADERNPLGQTAPIGLL